MIPGPEQHWAPPPFFSPGLVSVFTAGGWLKWNPASS